ncbi:MAG: glycosyltransferase family 39 protein [Chloroflexi bacterium]|nr:glycosyltransferase family 39 protein [Chloroflexota bacterium]
MRKRREWWLVAAVVLLAAGLRAVLASPTRVVWGDEPFYLWLGKNWLTGHGYTFTGYSDVHHTPLYPLLTGTLYLITHNLELASRIWYIVLGALLGVPVYLLARRLYGRPTAVLALLFVSLHPALTAGVIHWGTLTEPPYYLFIYTGLLAALLALETRKVWAYAGAGMLFALAYLTRPEAIAYLVAVGGYFLLVRLLERRLFTRTEVLLFAAYLAGFALFFMPYAVYVHGETGEWMISEKAGVTYVTSKSLAYSDVATFDRATWGLDSTGREVFFFSRQSYNVSMVQTILADPQDFLRLFKRNVSQFAHLMVSSRMMPVYLLPFLALGWFRRPWNRHRARGEGLILISCLPVTAFLLFFIQERYIATALPSLLIWAAHGVRETGEWLGETVTELTGGRFAGQRQRLALVMLPALVPLIFFAAMIPRVDANTSLGSWNPAHRRVGLWMKAHLPAGVTVMSRYPAIAFHADAARWVPTPNATWPEIRPYAEAKGVEYFVLEEREVRKLRPQLAPLLVSETQPPDLKQIYEDNEDPENRLFVFRYIAGG